MTPRRILIDARKLGDGGIGVYLQSLLTGLCDLAPQAGLKLSALIEPERLAGEGKGDAHDISQLLKRLSGEIEWLPEPAGKYSVGEYLLGCKRGELLRRTALYHAPHYTLPFMARLFIGGLPPAQVVTVHDAIHVTHPDSIIHRVGGTLLLGSALRRADRVITVSEESRRVLCSLASEAAGKITVIPNALREGVVRRGEAEVQTAFQALGLKRGPLLFVGSDRPHKGFRRLIDAWRMLPATERPDLVAVGTRFRFVELRAQLQGNMELQDHLHFIGALDTKTLSCLYTGARALVIPSSVEGFGLPALEALACGTPIVCSPLPSVREVAGELAWYAPDFTAAGLSGALAQLLSIPEDDNELDRRRHASLLRAEKFSIKEVAARTLEVYEQCIAGAAKT